MEKTDRTSSDYFRIVRDFVRRDPAYINDLKDNLMEELTELIESD